jgi:hypothetical protein
MCATQNAWLVFITIEDDRMNTEELKELTACQNQISLLQAMLNDANRLLNQDKKVRVINLANGKNILICPERVVDHGGIMEIFIDIDVAVI